MLLVDAHVHIHDCYNVRNTNFKFAAERLGHENNFTGILLLTETPNENWFGRLANYAGGRDLPAEQKIGNWTFHCTNEKCSLLAQSGDSRNLCLIAGRQIVSAEGLEILALLTNEFLKDGDPILTLIETVRKYGGIPVIPWGFGKWIGRRGEILKKLLKEAKNLDFFLGDNSARPWFLPRPTIFKIAADRRIRIFPGSDTLPFVTEYYRAGSFGFSLSGIISSDHPARDLKNMLTNSSKKLQPFGELENPFRFFRNQIRMQINKRFLR
jgi:hypothetical protein